MAGVISPYSSVTGAALTANNLSDLASESTARTHLGLFVANYGEPLATGEGNMSRLLCTNSFSLANQGLLLTYWVAATSQTCNNIITHTAATGLQSVDDTVAQLAVFAVNPSTGALTSQLAITANLHATLWASTYTAYTSAFTSSWSQVAGTTYCVAALCVATGVFPALAGATPSCLNAASVPFLTGYVASQATMPSSVASGSITGGPSGNQCLYAVLTP